MGQTWRNTARRRLTRVDPHSRGANIFNAASGSFFFGGPPLAWGKQPSMSKDLIIVGWTPTRVGQTARKSCSPLPGAVDPHSRGANDFGILIPLCVPPPNRMVAEDTRIKMVDPHSRGANRQVTPALPAGFKQQHCPVPWREGGPPLAWGKHTLRPRGKRGANCQCDQKS